MIKLTARQQEILDFIRYAIEKTGFPPTRAEIAKALGFRSPNAAEDHLKALVKKGAITVLAGTSRGIRLNADFNGEHLETPSRQVASSDASITPASQLSFQHTSQHTSVSTQQAAASQAKTKAIPPTTSTIKDALKHLSNSVTDAVTELLNLPVVGRVAAGNPILAEENLDKTLHLDPALFTATPDYLLKVKGESMRDVGILDGDLLAVKRQTEARNGQIIVARIDDEVTVKRFVRAKSHIELLPENSDFEPIIVTQDREFTIEGIAVGLIRQQQFH